MAERSKSNGPPDGRSAQELLREMREKAEAERREILEAANARAAAIGDRAVRERERVEHEGLALLDGELTAERDRIVGRVRGEARSARLAFKRSALDAVFEEAAAEIEKHSGRRDWDAALAGLIDEAVAFTGDGSVVVVSDEDLPACRKIIESRHHDCTVKSVRGPHGTVTAESADGRRRADNSLNARLQRVRRSRAAEIARILFEAP